jgi:hypothetical protein
MGRSILSFRQLLEIEKLKMTSFKKMLPTKKDKQKFDDARLYKVYLGNASNPIPLESIFIGAIFHNYKHLLLITKEDTVIDENSLKHELVSLLENKPEGKTYSTGSVKSGTDSYTLFIKMTD